MLEGTIHGLMGAGLAVPALFVVDSKVLAYFQESEAVPLFRGDLRFQMVSYGAQVSGY